MSSHWIVPIIQGYVENNLCLMEFDENQSLTPTGAMMMANINRFNKDPLKYWLTIISRRSRHRAGKFEDIDSLFYLFIYLFFKILFCQNYFYIL